MSILLSIPCRISFANLASPRKIPNGDETAYSVECRVDKKDEKTIFAIRKAIRDAVVQKFGEEKKQWPATCRMPTFSFNEYLSTTGQDGFPLRDGDSKEDEAYHGQVYLSAKDKKNRPRCGKMIDAKKYTLFAPDEIEEQLYSGCYANVLVSFFGFYHVPTSKKGVGVGLVAVMKTGEGERLGGGSASVDLKEFFGEESQSLDSGSLSGGSETSLDI